jgi:hypothetical protein
MWEDGISEKPSVLRLVNCIDRQRPPKKSTAIMTIIGVSGDRNEQANNDTAVSSPLTIRTHRKPKRRITGVVIVFIARFPANTAKIRRPELNALMPKAT